MAEHQDDHTRTEGGHGGRKREQHGERPGTSPVGDQAEKDQAEGRDRPPADRGRPKNTPWLGGG